MKSISGPQPLRYRKGLECGLEQIHTVVLRVDSYQKLHQSRPHKTREKGPLLGKWTTCGLAKHHSTRGKSVLAISDGEVENGDLCHDDNVDGFQGAQASFLRRKVTYLGKDESFL